MGMLMRMVLRHRARKSTLHSLRFAERLRKRNSEFAPSYRETLESIGDELAIMARDQCDSEAERRALLQGLLSAMQRMYRNDPQLAQRVTRRLAPRVLSARPVQSDGATCLKAAI